MMAVEMLSEAPTPAQDLFVTGLAQADDLGDGTYRLYFYTKQQSIYGGGEDYVITCRMIATPSAMLHGAKLVLKALGIVCLCSIGKRLSIH